MSTPTPTDHKGPLALTTAVHTPIPRPHQEKKRVKHVINRGVALAITEPVPVDTPTTWCFMMGVTPKMDGTPRRTIDLQKLNAATTRTHHTPSTFNQVSLVPTHTRKTVLDTWTSYHSLPLSQPVQELSSPKGANIDTFGSHRNFTRREMHTHADLTI